MEGSASARDQRLAIGAMLGGKYKVVGLLGQGRMGRVVLAHDKDRKVVLKVLTGGLGADREVVARFTREARAAMELRGEHVARVTEVGVFPDVGPYLATEYLEGQTLAQLVKKGGPLPVNEAVGYLLQVIEAVSEAHFQKIIHKNLAPANLFLVPRSDGSAMIKVVDFGMSSVDPMTDSATQRKEGNAASAYLSPEQSKGGVSLDARADVWSLGVVLYELLTGALPFDLATGAVTAKSVRSVRADLPESIDAIITRCLQRDLKLRYASVRDLAQSLAPFAAMSETVDEDPDPSGKEKIITMPGVAPPSAMSPAAPKVAPVLASSADDDDLAWDAEPTVPPFVQGPSPAPVVAPKPQPVATAKPPVVAKPVVSAKPQPSSVAPVVAKTGTSPKPTATAPKAQPSAPSPVAPKAQPSAPGPLAAKAAAPAAPKAQPSAPGPVAAKAAGPVVSKAPAPRARAATLVGIAPPAPPAPAVVAAPPRAESQTYEEGMLVADRYELVRLIGKGGFGQVWMAKSRALDSLVALKLFVRGGADIEGGAERLLAEARAAAQLEHPAIVRVFDFGETSRGDPFLVMELLRGESLEDVLERQGPMNPARLAAILLPIVDALGTAHAKGIIHRDIKPANLFLGRSDSRGSKPDALGSVWLQPKVIDFGLVKRHEEGQLRITQEGALAGSPAYMSPEQVQGAKVDARTDVWSLSIVMYELLTGRMPFPVTTQYELFKALVEREPEPIVEQVDPGLVAIVLRGLAKPVDARWPSMHDLGMALARWLDAQGVTVDASGASIRETWLDAHIPISIAPPSTSSPTSPQAAALMTTQDQRAPVKTATEMDALWRNVAANVVAAPGSEDLEEIEVEEIVPLKEASAPVPIVASPRPSKRASAATLITTPVVARASIQPPPSRGRPLVGMAIGALVTLGVGLGVVYWLGHSKEPPASTPPTATAAVATTATPVTPVPTPANSPSATPTVAQTIPEVPPSVVKPPVPPPHASTKASAVVKPPPPPSNTAHVRPPPTGAAHPTTKPPASAKPDKELGF